MQLPTSLELLTCREITAQKHKRNLYGLVWSDRDLCPNYSKFQIETWLWLQCSRVFIYLGIYYFDLVIQILIKSKIHFDSVRFYAGCDMRWLIGYWLFPATDHPSQTSFWGWNVKTIMWHFHNCYIFWLCESCDNKELVLSADHKKQHNLRLKSSFWKCTTIKGPPGNVNDKIKPHEFRFLE